MKRHLPFLVLLSITCITANCIHRPPKTSSISKNDEHTPLLNNQTVLDSSRLLTFASGVRSLFEDSRGHVWFGSHNEGVCRFDGENFDYFTVEDGLSDNQVRSIQEDLEGNLWFDTGDGITSFDGTTFTIHTADLQPYEHINLAISYPIDENDLWFQGGRRSGVYRYGIVHDQGDMTKRALRFLPFPIPKNHDENNPFLITDIDVGPSGIVRIATYPGVFSYDGQKFELINDALLGLNDQTGRLHVRSICEGRDGKLWIGNNGIGVLLYENDTTVNFSSQAGLTNLVYTRHKIIDSNENTLARIFSIEEDDSKNIWFGTADSGIWRYNERASMADGKPSLDHFTIKDGLTSLFIWDIYVSKSGQLWLAMANGNVCQFNGTNFRRIF